jgi:hypothetical protein
MQIAFIGTPNALNFRTPVLLDTPTIISCSTDQFDLSNDSQITISVSKLVTHDFQLTSDAFALDVEFLNEQNEPIITRLRVEYDQFVEKKYSVDIHLNLKEILSKISLEVSIIKLRVRYLTITDFTSNWSNPFVLAVYGKGLPKPK